MKLDESHIGKKMHRKCEVDDIYFIPKFFDCVHRAYGVDQFGSGMSSPDWLDDWLPYEEPPKRVERGVPVYRNSRGGLDFNEITTESIALTIAKELDITFIGFMKFDPVKGVFYWEGK